MYKPLPYLSVPPPEAPLWRYLSFTKFVSLLQKQALFFSSVARLGDPFEGSYPRGNIARRSDFMLQKSPEERRSISKNVEAFTKEARHTVVVNCWHRSSHESEAMWKLYSGEREGIAIKTDFTGLSRSFVGPKEVFIGEVRYIDYENDIIDEEENQFGLYLTKRKSFEHEAEVRALGLNIPMKNGQIDRSPQARHQPGVYREVDLGILVREVVVAPYADQWFVDLVTETATRYALASPIRRSSLADPPRWNW